MAPKLLSKTARRRVQRALDGEKGAFEKLKTPTELHYFAWEWNWDDGFEPLRAIIRDPRCDQGTALLIYWHAGPGWFCRFANRDEVADADPHEIGLYDLVKEIENRYLGGFYKEQHIRFDPSNDRGTDWIRENAAAECTQPLPDKLREASPGVDLLPWADLFQTRIRSITDKELEKINKLIAVGLKLLQPSNRTPPNEQDDPAQTVQLIDSYIINYCTRTQGNPHHADAEKETDKLSDSLGYLWADQVRRAYGWDWVAWDWGDGAAIMLKPPAEESMVKPTVAIRQSLACSFMDSEKGIMSRFFNELEHVRSWPNRRITELISLGWIFWPPWADLRGREPS